MASEEELISDDSARLESDLVALLDGKSTSELHIDLCTSEGADKFHPITKHNICYIVCGVIFNDDDEVLMMQEAKMSCRGDWYLPAGRLEPDETLEEGVMREVLEETGIKFEPTTLLCVEIQGCFWQRYTFTGQAVGGSLKTLAEKDVESLQARWCSVDQVRHGLYHDLPLRCRDILKLIDVALNYRSTPSEKRHPSLLPVIANHDKLILRIVTVFQISGDVFVLINKDDFPHFPTGLMNPSQRSFLDPLAALLQSAFGRSSTVPNVNLHGLLSLQHSGKPEAMYDGIAMTVLTSFPSGPNLPLPVNKKYSWHKILESETATNIVNRLASGMTVSIFPLK